MRQGLPIVCVDRGFVHVEADLVVIDNAKAAEMAIAGFDDMYWSISLNPPLTAVLQPGYEIGKQAVEMLFSRLSDPDRETRKIILNTRLMIRKSCGSMLNAPA